MVTRNQQSSNFGERLKFERKRLGLTQKEMAMLLGKTKQAAYHYEKNDRDVKQDDLQKLQAAGFDVVFLQTGNKMIGQSLQADEVRWLELWQLVDVQQQVTLLALAENFVQSFPKK